MKDLFKDIAGGVIMIVILPLGMVGAGYIAIGALKFISKLIGG